NASSVKIFDHGFEAVEKEDRKSKELLNNEIKVLQNEIHRLEDELKLFLIKESKKQCKKNNTADKRQVIYKNTEEIKTYRYQAFVAIHKQATVLKEEPLFLKYVDKSDSDINHEEIEFKDLDAMEKVFFFSGTDNRNYHLSVTTPFDLDWSSLPKKLKTCLFVGDRGFGVGSRIKGHRGYGGE
ncbi:hypothetical protein CU098_007503, partial [Rhizopus stolonifer]